MYVSILLYAGCSGSDEPKPEDTVVPFNCATSDLQLALAPNGDIDPTSCLSNDGSIQVMATGGKEPYQFAIGTGSLANSSSFSSLGAGIFQVTVQDANACSRKLSVTLIAPGAPTAMVTNQTENTNCTAPYNGSLTVAASGGAGPYEYKIDAGTFTSNPTFTGVQGGDHVVTIKDNAGCAIVLGTSVPKGITGVNYIDDIRPIFQAKCNFSGCHPDNGEWLSYSVAKAKASEIKSLTQSRTMPKNGGAAQGGSLSTTQIALIACWVDDGAPEN